MLGLGGVVALSAPLPQVAGPTVLAGGGLRLDGSALPPGSSGLILADAAAGWAATLFRPIRSFFPAAATHTLPLPRTKALIFLIWKS